MRDQAKERVRAREARHRRVRAQVSGTAERPRLCVRRSLKHVFAQLVDDVSGKSLAQVSSLTPEIRTASSGKKKVEVSSEVGKLVAERAKAAGIENVVFDRGGYLYHGRVKALADGAREAGLKF